MISGVVIVSSPQWFPLRAVLSSMAPVCSEIIVNADTTSEGTVEAVREIAKTLPVQIIESAWNWEAKDKGQEIARQTNLAVERATSEWLLDLQADEVLHEDEHPILRAYVENAPADISGFQMVRLYFFESLDVLRTDWTQPLTRLFRKGSHVVAGDGMDTQRLWGNVAKARGVHLYHYSRIGDAKAIVDRIMKLSSLFHERATLTHAPQEYDFTRLWNYDSFSTDNPPESVDAEDVLVPFTGSHPKYIHEYYQAVAQRAGIGAVRD